MANNQPIQQDTSLEVKTGLPVAQKLTVSIIILGAFLGGVGLAMGFGEIPIGKTPKTRTPQVRPMKITDLGYSTPVASDVGFSLRYQGWTGNLEQPVTFGLWDFPGEDERYDGASALGLPLYIEAFTEHDAIFLTLLSDETTTDPVTAYHVCIPASPEYVARAEDPSLFWSALGIPTANAQATPFTIEPITDPYRYWVDIRGNTYADRGLTQKLNPGDCATTVSKALVPTDITAISLAAPFVNDAETDIVAPAVDIDNLRNGDVVRGTIEVLIGAQDVVAVADVSLYAGDVLVAANIPHDPEPSEYYYRTNLDTTQYPEGDLVLRATATDTSNNTRENSVTVVVDNVPGTSPISSVEESIVKTPTIINPFIIWMGRNMANLAFYYPNDDTSSLSDQTIIDSASPLYMRLLSHGEAQFPNNVLVIETDQGTINLCIPDSLVPDFDWASFDGSYNLSYFYDVNGTPYTDPLLTDRATSADCDDILARGFQPEPPILQASVSVGTPDQTYIRTRRGQRVFGDFFGTTWEVSAQNEPIYGDAPFSMQLYNFGTQGDKTFAASTAVFGGTQLCIPATTVPAEGNITFEGKTYYYDTAGVPYTDVLMSERVACGTQPPTGGTKTKIEQ